MNPSSEFDPGAIEGRILDYLAKHPEAADSLEGIAAWWLPQSGHPYTIEAVQQALARMVASHHIALIALADGRTLYQSVNKVSGSHPVLPQSTPRKPP